MTAFDPYHKWLGIPPAEQPPDHYRLLTLSRFEPDPEVIEAAAERIVTFLQTVATGQYVAESQQLLNQVAAARRCLLKAESRVAYDEELRVRQPEVASTPISPPAPSWDFPSVSPVPPRRDAPEATGTTRHGRGPGLRSALLLQLVAGSGFVVALGLAVVAWGLFGNAPTTSRLVKAPQKPSPVTSNSSAKRATKPTDQKIAADHSRQFEPTAQQKKALAESKVPPRDGAISGLAVLPRDPAVLEPHVSGWRPTRPPVRLRVERGALVLEGTGAATTDFRPVDGPVTIELKAGGDRVGKVRVLWTEIGLQEFMPERSVELDLAPGGQWQELTSLLPVRGRLTGLRIDPPEELRLFELDWVHVKDSEGKTVKEWGFGASAGKNRKASNN